MAAPRRAPILIHTPPPWRLPEASVTPRARWLDRRAVVRRLGLGLIGAGLAACADDAPPRPADPLATTPEAPPRPPAPRDPRFTADRPLTPERVAARYNNFYEFGTDKDAVWTRVGAFATAPWRLTLAGHCRNPGPIDVDDLLRRLARSRQERVYRFRCVEAWSMVVPWTGVPFAELVRLADPKVEATHVRLVTAMDAAAMPGVAAQPWMPWPYFESLRLDEAVHPLALLATGIYGHPLPRQHGAPLRLVVPWKYGFKSIKSLVRVEFVAGQPRTFWNSLAPNEYDVLGNVDPAVPHPRWSQSTERDIATDERFPTRPYNGYGDQVAGLYVG